MRPFVLMIIMTLATALPAHAAIREGSLEINPYLIFTSFDDESNIENDGGIGGRLAVFFHERHGLEFQIEYLPTEDDLNLGLDVDLSTVKIGYAYNFAPDARISPVVDAGGGFQHVKFSEELLPGVTVELGEETDPLLYGGIGVRFFTGSSFNVRLDGQLTAVFPDGEVDDTLIDASLLVGVGWVLGGR